jgi:predicted acetyltransferase
VYNPKKQVEGTMAYFAKGYGDKIFGPDIIGKMGNIRFCPTTLEAKHTLFHYIYLFSDQLIRAALPLYPKIMDNYQSWIQGHTKTEIKQHMVSMVRIVNVERVFEEIKVPSVDFGNINIEVIDPMCEWNNGILKLYEDNGKLHSNFYPDETVDAKISIEGLSALLYGTLSIDEIEYFGWIKNITEEERDILGLWLPRREYCCTEFF